MREALHWAVAALVAVFGLFDLLTALAAVWWLGVDGMAAVTAWWCVRGVVCLWVALRWAGDVAPAVLWLFAVPGAIDGLILTAYPMESRSRAVLWAFLVVVASVRLVRQRQAR
jgi:hypothetical protein